MRNPPGECQLVLDCDVMSVSKDRSTSTAHDDYVYESFPRLINLAVVILHRIPGKGLFALARCCP
eukprot:scaffold878_cov153-Skeletonema_marinoi.AAC.3